MRAFLGIMAVVSSFFHQSILAQPDLDKIELVKAGKCSEARADWWGFDAANSTEFLQAAIDSGAKRLVVPNMGSAWIVNPIALASDQEIVFEPGVVVEAIRGGFHGKSDCLFSAKSKRNIILKGQDTVFRMHKKDYQDKSQYEPAEWRSGLGLYSCENVQVSGITIKSTGGDGIYVGSCRVPTNYCKDIVVRDCVLDDNHRQGMSVISVVNLLLENCVISNTRGTAPQAGIDFEPNSSKERLFGIVIKNCRFENNAGGAIILSSRVTTNSEPVSFHFENCVAFENRFTGGFGRNPPMDLVSVTMTNCVERFQGTERILNDFWVDWQNMKALDEQQRAIVAKTGHVSLRELKLQPLKKEGASKPGKPTRQPILRGKARFVAWIVGGGDGQGAFTVNLLKDYGKGMELQIRTPSGALAPIISIGGRPLAILAPDGVTEEPVFSTTLRGKKKVVFSAAETGVYTIELDPGPGWFEMAPEEQSMAFLADEGPVNLFARPGTYYFLVPEGVTDFYVEAAGQGGEKIKVTVLNPAGEPVAVQDPVSIVSRFPFTRKGSLPEEIWAIKVEKSPGNYMEDYSLDLYGVPPVFAVDKDALLKP